MALHLGHWLAMSALSLSMTVILACDSGGRVATPSATGTASKTAPSVSVSDMPAATAFPAVPSSLATRAGCPIDDVALCEFAVALQDALNAAAVNFITQHLVSEARPCRNVIYAPDEDVGCATPEATSLPLVILLRFQGDCCSTRAERFEPQLVQWIDKRANGQRWRLYAVVPRAPLWDGGAEILVVRGEADDAPTIGVGTSRREQIISVPGVIIGSRAALFVGPDEELLPWP